MFEDAKLLATLTSAVEWYKSRAHTFLSEVIEFLYVTTQHNVKGDTYGIGLLTVTLLRHLAPIIPEGLGENPE